MPEIPKVERWQLLAVSPDMQSEEAKTFFQGMLNRTGISYHKYGTIYDAFPHRRTGVDNVGLRIREYLKTGNTEFLIDAANYCLIEFLCPSVEGAKFEATDSDRSPGAVNKDGTISHGKAAPNLRQGD